MNKLHEALITRFPATKISEIFHNGELYFLLDLEQEKGVQVLMTSDFHEYQMPTPEKLEGMEFGELFFCLPSYWDILDSENASMNWVFEWLKKIKEYTINQQTWLGDGHTYNCTKNNDSLSVTMKQNHFFVSQPLLLSDELAPMTLGDKTIHFWALIPIFSDEMDYKQGKGTLKFKKKLISKGVSEKLDDYRQTSLKTRWLFF